LPWRIEYKASVQHDLRKIGRADRKRIIDLLEAALSEDADRGEPLTGQFRGLRKFRVSEYRVIYCREKDRVLVLRIGHRSTVYR
jgi:addiction module RelE/StbE family toxin